MKIREGITFGLSRGKALLYSLDNYSRPDNWHGIGYELQYELVVFFNKIVRETDRIEFLSTLPATFSHSFSIPQDHVVMELIPDDKLSDLLENAFGIPLDEDSKMQPPFDMLRGIQFRVLWDRGRFDLRILNRLENEIDSIAVINHSQVVLANLIIIPRSSATIGSKLKEISDIEDQT